jgi:septal ring factor EnvC (AmiA/AmiB activator)
MQDYIYLGKLRSKMENAVLLPLMNPLEIFTFIGRLDYLISSSLHGGIFSYRHNVPFILFNYNEKMSYFMKDRGLERYSFTSFTEMKTSFYALLRDAPDYSKKISKDMDLLEQHVQNLKEILGSRSNHEEESIKDSKLAIYQIQNLQSQIISLKAQMKAYEREIEIKEREIEDLQSSVIRQITMRFSRGFTSYMIPEGSRRRTLCGLCSASFRIIVNDGPVVLLRRLKRFILLKIYERNGDS